MTIDYRPENIDLILTWEDHRQLEISFVDGASTPVDLTGLTAVIKGATGDAEPLITATIVDPPTDGKVLLDISTADIYPKADWRLFFNDGTENNVALTGTVHAR